MMYRLWTYLRFLVHSTNQHGVHSPFVYQYLTNSLYKRTRHKGSRVMNVLLKSIQYFNLQSIILRTDAKDLENQLFKVYPDLTLKRSPADLIYIGKNQLLEITAGWLHDQCHEGSMVLLEDIHGNRKTSAMWDSLCQNSWATVSIDFYFGGIIFLRAHQVKQHFRIRI